MTQWGQTKKQGFMSGHEQNLCLWQIYPPAIGAVVTLTRILWDVADSIPAWASERSDPGLRPLEGFATAF